MHRKLYTTTLSALISILSHFVKRKKSISSTIGMTFITNLFMNNDLHLNTVGTAGLGRLLSDKVSVFRRKNSMQPPTASKT